MMWLRGCGWRRGPMSLVKGVHPDQCHDGAGKPWEITAFRLHRRTATEVSSFTGESLTMAWSVNIDVGS
jgi:hypothetical protein